MSKKLIQNLLTQVSVLNLADDMEDERLDKISQGLMKGFEADEVSRAEWLSRSKDYIKLALQVKETKNVPWPNSANVKFPLLSVASMHFNARMYPALVSGQDIVKTRVVGFDQEGRKAQSALRVSKHMSYQLLDQMKGWDDDMDVALFTLPMVGTFFKKIYYDPIDEVNVSELVMPQNLVVNFYSKSLDEAERVTHIMTQSSNELLENEALGIYRDIGLFEEEVNEDENLDPTKPQTISSVTPEHGVMGKEHIDELQGLTKPSQVDNTVPHEILEMHCWMDLDDDHYEEPYIVTIHKETGKILRIVARYKAAGVVSLDDKNEDLVKIVPSEYFVSFKFLPDPQSGVYGLGFGTLLGPLNEAVNTLINQLLDAGTLSNLQSGWVSPGIKVRGGIFKFKPGEWKIAQFTGDDINKKIMPLPVREPSNVLLLLLGTLTDEAAKLSSVMDIMTGELPGQNTKATVVLQAVEQGSKVFNAIAKRLYRQLGVEFKMLFNLNSEFLEDEEYFNVLDLPNLDAVKITLEDYNIENMSIFPAADPTISSQTQKIAKIQSVEGLLAQGLINPQKYASEFVKAVELDNQEEWLNLPEPQPDEEFELEKAIAEANAQHEQAKLQIMLKDSESKAKTAEADWLRALADINDMLEKGDAAKAQQLVSERQQILDERNNQINHRKDVAQMQLDQQQGQQTTSTEE